MNGNIVVRAIATLARMGAKLVLVGGIIL
jgi:hypothetical protein